MKILLVISFLFNFLLINAQLTSNVVSNKFSVGVDVSSSFFKSDNKLENVLNCIQVTSPIKLNSNNLINLFGQYQLGINEHKKKSFFNSVSVGLNLNSYTISSGAGIYNHCVDNAFDPYPSKPFLLKNKHYSVGVDYGVGVSVKYDKIRINHFLSGSISYSFFTNSRIISENYLQSGIDPMYFVTNTSLFYSIGLLKGGDFSNKYGIFIKIPFLESNSTFFFNERIKIQKFTPRLSFVYAFN